MNRQCRRGVGLLLLALGLPSLALAQGASSAAPATTSRGAEAYHPREAVGERTARLLELQRGGRVASAQRQTLSGEVQTRIYDRYVESFSHAVPETYIDLDFGE